MTVTRKYLTEVPLSRIWGHVNNPDKSVGFMSAHRDVHDPDENLRRNRELAAKVKAAGYGYFFVTGKWKGGEEDSIVAIANAKQNDKLKGDLQTWRDEYDQDAVLHKPSGQTTGTYLKRGGDEEDAGEFHPNRVSAYMSKLHGRPGTFAFESIVAYEGKGFWGSAAEDHVVGG